MYRDQVPIEQIDQMYRDGDEMEHSAGGVKEEYVAWKQYRSTHWDSPVGQVMERRCKYAHSPEREPNHKNLPVSHIPVPAQCVLCFLRA